MGRSNGKSKPLPYLIIETCTLSDTWGYREQDSVIYINDKPGELTADFVGILKEIIG